jgi:hypothetical protein
VAAFTQQPTLQSKVVQPKHGAIPYKAVLTLNHTPIHPCFIIVISR